MLKQEIINILNHNPKQILGMSEQDLKDIFGSEFSLTKNYSQNNPHHCYTLLEHTIKTIEALDCTGLDYNDVTELKVAALYHDVGKPAVAIEKEDGRTVFYNHAQESKKIAEKELLKSGFEGESLKRILFYIEHHDTFISFKHPYEIIDESNPYIIPIQKATVDKRIFLIKTECEKTGSYVPNKKDFVVLLRLCMADARSQSENVIINGVLVDSRKNKEKRVSSILKIIQNDES